MEDNLKICIEALEKIAYPIKHLQKEADKDGYQLDGIAAINLAKDAAWLSDIAKKALSSVNQQPN